MNTAVLLVDFTSESGRRFVWWKKKVKQQGCKTSLSKKSLMLNVWQTSWVCFLNWFDAPVAQKLVNCPVSAASEYHVLCFFRSKYRSWIMSSFETDCSGCRCVISYFTHELPTHGKASTCMQLIIYDTVDCKSGWAFTFVQFETDCPLNQIPQVQAGSAFDSATWKTCLQHKITENQPCQVL